MKNILQTIKIIVFAAVLTVGMGYVMADWTPPLSAPTTCVSGNPGCDAPIHVGRFGQTKDGNLIIQGLTPGGQVATNGLIILNGRVGIGTTNPREKLQVSGDVMMGNAAANSGELGRIRTVTNYFSGPNQDQNDALIFEKTDDDTVAEGGIVFGFKTSNGTDVSVNSPNWAVNDSHVMFIRGNGNVGIGISAPKAKLDVNAGGSDGTGSISISSLADVDLVGPAGTDLEFGFSDSSGVVTQRVMKITPSKRVGIAMPVVSGEAYTENPTQALDVNGQIRIRGGSPEAGRVLTSNASGVGTWQTAPSSDISLKKNIRPLTDSLSKILKLGGVSFNWKNPEDPSPQIGFIAQDVEKVFPEVVHIEGDGTKSVDYQKLVAPLVEAVKAQQSQIERLKAEIEALKKAE